MGMYPSKSSSSSKGRPFSSGNSSNGKIRRDQKMLYQQIRQLQQELSHITRRREEESKAYEREMMAFSLKESDWKKDRRRLKEEVRRLQMELEEREMLLGGKEDDEDGIGFGEEKKTMMMVEMDGGGRYYGLDSIATEFLMEQMREERARRDEAVEKWKMLYLAIKNELDDLIKTTHQGGGALGWKQQEDELIEEIEKKLRDKDDTIEVLRAQIVSMEQEEYKRKREVDILRQSLRIMTSKKKSIASRYTC